MAEIGPEEFNRIWLSPFCSENELQRVLSVSNVSDHLLRLRADTIADHPRFTRVFLHRRRNHGGDWSLSRAFDDRHYVAFLSHLTESDRQQIAHVGFGDIFSADPNGIAQHTPYGPLVTLCCSLRYFCRFAHLALLDFGDIDVPIDVRKRALLIAVRVMFKYEALDFTLDPRGVVPEPVARAIAAPVQLELEWIAGHEFSHVLLGHLSDVRIVEYRMLPSAQNSERNVMPKIYTRSHDEEFVADREAILRPQYTDVHRAELRDAALLWLAALQLYETALDTVAPRIDWHPRSHPSAKDRFDALLRDVRVSSAYGTDTWKELQNSVLCWQEILVQFLTYNIDAFETYGSFYLAEPNTKWRGPELIDRVHY